MIANPIYEGQYYVNVNDITTVQTDGNILIELPDTGEELLFIGKNIEFTSLSDFIYYGELDTCDIDDFGYLNLLSKGGNIFGELNYNNDVYEVQDLGGNKNVIFKLNSTPTGACGSNSPNANSTGNFNSNKRQVETNCDVSVLFLFTANANSVGDPENTANLILARTNQAARNSEAKVNFILAGVEEITPFMELSTIRATRNAIKDDDDAKDIRNDKAADLVVLFTDGNWPVNPSNPNDPRHFLGVSYLAHWGDPEYNYCVVEIDAESRHSVCSHEIGHQFGCKHQNDNDGPPEFIFEARAHQFRTGPFWKRTSRVTIMNDISFPRANILHYSNPSVKFKRVKTGVHHLNNNAEQLKNMGCTMADYRIPQPSFNVNITGPHKGDNMGTYTWCINLTSCNNPTSIIWEYSIDGITFYPLATGDYCVTSQLPLNRNLMLRVTVTCQNGSVATDFHGVVNLNNNNHPPCNPPNIEENLDIALLENLETNNIVIIHPNPTKGLFTIDYTLIEKSIVKISIFNLQGKKHKILENQQKEKGSHSDSFDIANLEPGYYFINIIRGNDNITKSIIKL